MTYLVSRDAYVNKACFRRRSRGRGLEPLKGKYMYSAGLVDSFGKKIVDDDRHLICPHRAPISPEVLRKTLRGDPADVGSC